jgi:hypothetical protein
MILSAAMPVAAVFLLTESGKNWLRSLSIWFHFHFH